MATACDWSSPASRRYITRARSFADRVLLNKADLVSAVELDTTRALVRGLNGTAKLFVTTRTHGVELTELIGISAFDPARHVEEWGALEDIVGDENGAALGSRVAAGNNVAAHSISVAGEIDIDKFNEWITELLRKRGDRIFRTKARPCQLASCASPHRPPKHEPTSLDVPPAARLTRRLAPGACPTRLCHMDRGFLPCEGANRNSSGSLCT